MSQWLKVCFLLIVSSTFVACGGSGDKKAQDRAEDLTTEYNRLVKEVNASSVPSISWTDAELTAYEAKLNRMAYLKTQLDKADGKNGVTIFGGDNSRFIAERKELIAKLRTQKAKPAQSQAPPTPTQVAPTGTTTGMSKVSRLKDEMQAQRDEMDAMGSPSPDGSEEKLWAYEAKGKQLLRPT